MSIKKCVNGSFVNDFYREYGTDTNTITSLPKTIIGDGQPISSYTIKGNMSQSGTPTPSNPVYPTECGEETANLLNPDSKTTNQTGDERWGGEFAAGTYYVLNNTSGNIFWRDGVSSTGSTPIASGVGSVVTVTNALVVWHSSRDVNIMVADSSVSVPFEPYGYKIPISFDSNTYTFYLSEPIRKINDSVDTATSSGTASRNIKKLVLTGTEDWIYQSDYNRFLITISDAAQFVVMQAPMLCTHYQVIDDGRPISDVPNNSIYFNNKYLCITTTDQSSKTDLNNYLAAQYANGTPVTVWYVLATPTTETFTAPTIPTSGTAESFDVDTTLKPSEVSLTYHGWHEHSDTKFT